MARNDARTALPVVCVIMLHIVVHAASGKVKHCQRSAAVPICVTSALSRKIATMGVASSAPTIARPISTAVDSRTQNQNASRTRA